jgi:hypothetical protein
MDEDTEDDFRMSFQPSSFSAHAGMTFSSHSIPTTQQQQQQQQSFIFDQHQHNHYDHHSSQQNQPALFPRLGYTNLQKAPHSPSPPPPPPSTLSSHEQQQEGVYPPLHPSSASGEFVSNPGSLSFEALLHMYARQPQANSVEEPATTTVNDISSPHPNMFLPLTPTDTKSTTSTSGTQNSQDEKTIKVDFYI